jgi:uncharacterized damage-inducible protein DinB
VTEFVGQSLKGALFRDVSLRGAKFRLVDLREVSIRGAWVTDVEINGEVENLRVNGVDVAPYVEAELDRRDPDRPKMRPAGPDGFRAAWELLERRWAGTVDRARALDPELLHERVDGEWSFTQTLRHLVFATDAWVRRAVLGEPAAYHPLGLPDDSSEDAPGVPCDPGARPALDEILAVRTERQRTVRDYLAGLTDERLGGSTTPLTEPGYPETGVAFPIREVLLTILNEEYMHRQYAERDLDALTART